MSPKKEAHISHVIEITGLKFSQFENKVYRDYGRHKIYTVKVQLPNEVEPLQVLSDQLRIKFCNQCNKISIHAFAI